MRPCAFCRRLVWVRERVHGACGVEFDRRTAARLCIR